MKSKKFLQIIRFITQACFLTGLFFPVIIHADVAAKYMFWSVLLCGVFFCGWVCPFGAIQDWLAWIARKLKCPHFRVPHKVQKYLQFTRYILYALSTFGITFVFLNARYNFNHDMVNGMLSVSGGIILAVFLISALFIDRPFCNYFCLKGAVDGMMSIVRPLGIKRNNQKCIHCHLCDRNCPMNILVENTNFVRHPNCINCMKCITACPKNCLAFKLMNLPEKKK
ncbi:MAG: 4Fe-4S binding protein [Alphaproteobacteria bacterium]|nr:4Fe-4S binding protein [Alphaproteobacteria bacterium]